MSTPLTDSINALTAYANETTGVSDTTLSDAVGRLCEGYGGGGLLASINPQVNQKNCKFDLDNVWLSRYKYFLIDCDIRITPSSDEEWVYFTCNSQTRSGARYYNVPTEIKDTGRFRRIVTAIVDDNKIILPKTGNVFNYDEHAILPSDNYFNIGLYNYNYSEGTIIKLYGIT